MDNLGVRGYNSPGRLPHRMAVGEATTLPSPRPNMYNPVVKATCGTVTSYVLETSLKPAARTGVMPPPTMQYRPSEINAASRRSCFQFRGSFAESSGCGSNMNLPSFVRLISGCRTRRDLDELREFAEALRGGGP